MPKVLRYLALFCALALLASCAASPASTPSASPEVTPQVTDEGEPTDPEETPLPEPTITSKFAPDEPFLPAPDRRVPRNPVKLARQLNKVGEALEGSVRRWTTKGDPSSKPAPRAVVLQTLYQQRIYRLMVKKPELANATIARLNGRTKTFAQKNLKAGRLLRSMIKRPLPPSATLRIGRFKAAGELLRLYKKAERRFGVAWEVLAAVNMIETKFGRVKSISSAGAQGPMQFMPGTWAAYGMGGDVYDPHDAIMGAANYLRASGAPGNYRQALWNYNHHYAYVDAVLAYARQMMRRPQNYFIYYNWQVYILTTAGDKRLTGPRPREGS